MSTPPLNAGPAPRGKRVLWFMTLSLLALSIILNALQVAKIRSMEGPLRRCADMVFGGSTAPSNIGTAPPVLKVHDHSGRAVELAAARPGKMTVLYLFSPQCGWCQRNASNMKALAKGAGPRYEFLPISLTSDGLAGFVTEQGLTGEVYADPSTETRMAYGFGATPTTIVVGSDGKIVKNWPGA